MVTPITRARGNPALTNGRKRQALAAVVRRCWKHSLQRTGRPCVGLNGTVVSLPQAEQLVRVSTLERGPEEIGPNELVFLALQALQRLGSFLNCLSWKNSCSPAVKTKSLPQSMHLRTLSWNSMESYSLQPVFPATDGGFRGRRADQTVRPRRFANLSLRYFPWVRPAMPHAWLHLAVHNSSYDGPHQHVGRKSAGPPCSSGPAVTLVLLFASFFAAALARQRFFYALLLARLEVEGVTLHFLNNVLSLHLALKATQGVLQRLALLNTYFGQREHTPKLVPIRTSLLSQCSGRKSSEVA